METMQETIDKLQSMLERIDKLLSEQQKPAKN